LESSWIAIVEFGVDWFVFSQYLEVTSIPDYRLADSLGVSAAETNSLPER